MSNNFAKNKPVVVLHVPVDENRDKAQVLTNDDGTPRVFPNLDAAKRYVSRHVEPRMFPGIRYVNEDPQYGAGDVEDTHGKKCLKCNGDLFLADRQLVSRIQGVGDVAMDVFLCKTCDADKLRRVLN